MSELKCSVQEPYKQAIHDFLHPIIQPSHRIPSYLEFHSYSNTPTLAAIRSTPLPEVSLKVTSPSLITLPTMYSTEQSSLSSPPPPVVHLQFFEDTRTRVKLVAGDT